MKLCDLDWNAVLRDLPRWQALSPAGRKAFLKLQPKVSIWNDEVPAAALDELLAAGMAVQHAARPGRSTLHPDLRPLLIAVRSMCRLPPPGQMGPALDPAYLEEQVTPVQLRPLAAEKAWYNNRVDRKQVASVVSSSEWVRGFLAAETPEAMVEWEAGLLTPDDRPRLVFRRTALQTRALVLALGPYPGGWLLHELDALLPDASPQTIGAALGAALRYLLVFASSDARSGTAVVGLLPRVALRLAASAPSTDPVPIVEGFDAPVRMADMTTLLVEAGAEPLPVRGNDGSFYVRTQNAIGALLMPLPEWVADVALPAMRPERGTRAGSDAGGEGRGTGVSPQTAARIAMAATMLVHRGFASVGAFGPRHRFTPTDEGRAWLTRPARERLKHLLDALRASRQRNPEPYASATVGEFFPTTFTLRPWKGLNVRRHLTAAFLNVPADGFVPLSGWLHHQSRSENPLLAQEKEPVVDWWDTPATRDDLEDAWFDLLHDFLMLRLVAYGGARLGRTGEGELAFSLTPAGRYLLGATDELEYAAEAEGEVLVQPDFEVVFLAPAPRLEAEIGCFAERTGTGVGALFRITRASVLRAAEQGLTAEQVLEILETASPRTGVPPNVARQVGGWMDATRRVCVRPAVLVECPDEETALRVKAFAGEGVSALTPTVLRLQMPDHAAKSLLKRLREKGIFATDLRGPNG